MRKTNRPDLWPRLAGAVALTLFAASASGETWPHATWYTIVVRPGDTFRDLGQRYHIPAATIARVNHIEGVSQLQSGRVLRIPAATQATREAVLTEALDNHLPNYAPPPRSFAETQESRSQMATAPPAPALTSARKPLEFAFETRRSEPRFVWPVAGMVISRFGVHGAGERNDGINILAEAGEPIHAAASGTVTYAGDALKGYGNLILIAHTDGFVTAYAHADTVAVARGDRVEQGQVIGTAGDTGGVDRPQLHFEIRHYVRPVDPGTFLLASR